MRANWEPEERQPEAKKAHLCTILFAENCEVTHDYLCEFLKYAVLGESSVPKPRWGQLFHQNHLNNVVVFVLQGMSQLHFYRFYLEFGFLQKALRHKFCLPSPSSDFLADIIGLQKKQTNEDLSRTMKGSLLCASSKASIHLQNDPIIQNYGSKKVCLMQCMLTKEEMKVFHFPLQGGCVMDELVKPDKNILDYLASFSGIMKKMLNPVTTKFKDIQRQLKALLPLKAVLVGNSLDLDLKALTIAELNLEALASHQELQAADQELSSTQEQFSSQAQDEAQVDRDINCLCWTI